MGVNLMIKYKYIEKQIKKGLYFDAYKSLISEDFSFKLNNIVTCFPKLNSIQIYMFLIYTISKEETIEKYIAICENLLYINPYIEDSYSLISWHLREALKIFPKNISIEHWIIDIFWGNPDSPFSDEELCKFAKDIIEVNPNDKLALHIIKELDG